ncbi:MAG: MerR family transcriptional regulator [Bacilli bacterium]
MLKIKEVAELVGVSVRTLHHYDQINLLKPEEVTDTGYRLYSEENLVILQQILFFKELGFSLNEIKKIIQSSTFDQKEALLLQQKMLIEKCEQLDNILETVNKTIRNLEGEIQMTREERFFGLNNDWSKYEEEAKKRWGKERVEKTNTNLKRMSSKEQTELSENWNRIFNQLGRLVGQPADSKEVQQVIEDWFNFLNANFGNYSLEAFSGLGHMYVADERFTENIDQYGVGVAELMSEAMALFASERRKEE